MPFLQVMSNRASYTFSYDNIATIDLSTIPADSGFCEYMQALNVARTDQEIAVLDSMPVAIQLAMLSVIHYAMEGDEQDRKQITFSWAPAYEWGVHIWEARAASGSPSAITINLEGPYPDT